MQAIGIVAEYNPFHNGHQYHIAQARSMHPSKDTDGVIAVMSGNFTQRGEAAIFDKWTRAEMALYGGADLVLELPTAFATRSAGYFASSAVQILAATGIVHHLSCGVESDNPAQLEALAAYLADEPQEYQTALQDQLKEGVSFPRARQNALAQLQITGADQLQLPNNILAFHYLQAIQQHQLNMKPLFVSRRGNYNDDTIPSSGRSYASASAIRKLLQSHDDGWQAQVPEPVQNIIQRQIQKGYRPMTMDIFEPIIFSLLRRSTPEQLTELLEINEGLEHRIYEAAHQTDTLEDLCIAIKSKRYTYTRVQRSLCHLLLNMTRDMDWTEPQYIRVLGFNSTGQKLLKAMKKTAQLPIIMRPARQRNLLSAQGQQMLALDQRATNLYMMGYAPSIRPRTNLDLLQMPVQIK